MPSTNIARIVSKLRTVAPTTPSQNVTYLLPTLSYPVEVITLDDMQHGQAMVSLVAVRMIAGRIRAACTVN